MKGRVRVEPPGGGALEQDLEGDTAYILERLATLATVIPKGSTWEGQTKWERKAEETDRSPSTS